MIFVLIFVSRDVEVGSK